MEVGHGPGQPGRAHLPPHRAGGEAEQLSGGQAAAVLAESARDQEDLGMSSYLDVKMMRMIMQTFIKMTMMMINTDIIVRCC